MNLTTSLLSGSDPVFIADIHTSDCVAVVKAERCYLFIYLLTYIHTLCCCSADSKR